MEQLGQDQQMRIARRGLPPLQALTVTILLVLGGLLFCDPGYSLYGSSPPAFALYLAFLTTLAAALVELRNIYARYRDSTRNAGDPVSRRDLMAVAAGVVAYTVAAIKMCDLLFQHHARLETWLESSLYIGIVSAIDHLLRERQARTADLASAPQPPARKTMAPSELCYAQAEDHYVKLVFRDRVEHKRARFSDVIAELGDVGLRVHKSFWVHRSAVQSSRRAGRRLMLVLAGGTEIPVGRANERAVLDALPASGSGIRTRADSASA